MPDKAWSWPRRLVVGVNGAIIVAITGAQTVGTVLPEVVVPSELLTLSQWAEPFRSTNGYGLFAVMTTTRPEIIVEGSDDGVTWKPYGFRWKPCELDRRAAVHLAPPAAARLANVVRGPGGRLPGCPVVLAVRAEAARGLARGARAAEGKPVPGPAAARMSAHACTCIDSRHGDQRAGGRAKTGDCSARR